MGLLRRNWKKLAEPLRKFDVEIVREFYTNAWWRDRTGTEETLWSEESGFPIVLRQLIISWGTLFPIKRSAIPRVVQQKEGF